MFPMALNAVDKVLDYLLADLVAKCCIVVEDRAHRLRLQQTGRQEQLNVFVQQCLVLGIT